MRKRGQNEGSIYQRTDGRWVGEVSLGFVNGKRKRKLFYGRTRKEVQERLTVALKASLDGLPLPSERETVGVFLQRWLEESKKEKLKPKTFTSYKQLVEKHLVPGLGRIPLAKLGPEHVQSFLNAKAHESRVVRKGDPESGKEPETRILSARTVQYLHAVLRHALRQAVRWGLVVRNVATLVDPPRVRRTEIQPLDVEQSKALLKAVGGQRLEALYSVALALGLRQGEALGLRWTDIDLTSGTMSIHAALQRVEGKLIHVDTKSDKSRRTLMMPRVVIEALQAHRVRQLQERLLAGTKWQDTGLVFCTQTGGPLDGRNVTKHLQRVLHDAKLPRKRFHDLRHTCASLLLAQGVSEKVIQETLGHSQIGLTMNTYSHLIPKLKQDAANRMDAALRD